MSSFCDSLANLSILDRQIERRVWGEKIRERNVGRSYGWKDQNWEEREEIEIVLHAESGIHFDIISPS